MDFYETSAKTGFNVDGVFADVARTIKHKIDATMLAAQGKKSANGLNLDGNSMFKGVANVAGGAAGKASASTLEKRGASSAKCCAIA